MQSDEELLERIGGGDAAAFTAFHARHREPVLRHVCRVVGDPAAAEDVVQEVFLRVWGKAGQWERRGSAKGWVYRIATNLSLNWIESRRAARRVAQPSGEEDAEDLLARIADSPEARPDAVLERAERIRRVREGVGRLSDGKRRVIDAYLDDAEARREIARRLGLPLGTVKSRLHYASRELRDLLGDMDE